MDSAFWKSGKARKMKGIVRRLREHATFSVLLAVIVMINTQHLWGKASTPHGSNSEIAESSSEPAFQLRTAMRKLWSDHVFWTRDYIIAAAGNQPDESQAAARLLKNQEDIGNAVAAYYGPDAGQKLTGLLKQHILIAVDLIKAAKANKAAEQKEASDRWQKNGDEIADFLSHANPNWPKATLVDMMRMHLATTTNEVVARLTKNWEKDAEAFDAAYDHILKMSDALSDGIIKQFPNKFGAKP